MPDIKLNVYDLPEQSQRNDTLYSMGLGFYHSGVEYNGHEYSFSPEGVSRTRPLLSEFGAVREIITIGYFGGSPGDFTRALNELQAERFAPGTYDVVRCNCNHFSEALCVALLGQEIPRWVNRAAEAGSSVMGEARSTSTMSSLPAPGVVKSPTLESAAGSSEASKALDTPTSGIGIFSWLFGSSSRPQVSGTVLSAEKSAASTPAPPMKKSNEKKELTPKQKELLAKIKGSRT